MLPISERKSFCLDNVIVIFVMYKNNHINPINMLSTVSFHYKFTERALNYQSLTNKQHNISKNICFCWKKFIFLLRQSLNVQVLLAAHSGQKSNA
jgi:hypothetical protein